MCTIHRHLPPIQVYRTFWIACLFVVCLASVSAGANTPVRSRADLEYGTVLFEYHQQNYFDGLIEQSYVAALGNPRAHSHEGQLLKGSMTLSYGMPDDAYRILNTLLDSEPNPEVRNRAWYYLARLYHARSNVADAVQTLGRIEGRLPPDLYLDYHYLATLLSHDATGLHGVEGALANMPADAPQLPYLLYNIGVSHLKFGNQEAAISNLQSVVSFANRGEEFLVLADRARHGLARLAMQEERLTDAWLFLQDIRTEGLYSNRALLGYAWTALQQQMYQTAIPALQLLNRRSIALPEVQEGKVLLGHVYEHNGLMNRALRSHIDAEQDFLRGLEQLAEAREIIAAQDVPEEFITNLEAIVDQSDWFAAQPSVDYEKLSPFLVDLMASPAFSQILRELAELYAIRNNLNYWASQTDQHDLILKTAAEKRFDDSMKIVIDESAEINERLTNQRRELGLIALSLSTRDQSRLRSSLDNASRELSQLDATIRNLRRQSEPYKQPSAYPAMVRSHHARIVEALEQAEIFIAKLEPLMRNMVNAELNTHEERMRYYLAQTRLAKARLYDTALIKMGPASSAELPAQGVN